MRSEDQLSRLLCELSALLLTILGTPHAAAGTSPLLAPRRDRAVGGRRGQVSPVGLAFLLLGASLALLLCGSVTFMIGFILMPWVLGLILFFYFVGFLSNLSGLGRAIHGHGAGAPSAAATSPKEMSGVTKQSTDAGHWL